MRSLNHVIKSLPAEQRARVEAKAKRLIKAETLRQLRTIANRTQQSVAAASGTTQYNISRLEGRDDMLLSTLKAYVDGLGGRLRVTAEIPGVAPVELSLFKRQAQRKRTKHTEARQRSLNHA